MKILKFISFWANCTIEAIIHVAIIYLSLAFLIAVCDKIDKLF